MSNEIVEMSLRGFVAGRKPLLDKVNPKEAATLFQRKGFDPISELIDIADMAKQDGNIDIQLKAVTQLLPYSYSKQSTLQEVKVEEGIPLMRVEEIIYPEAEDAEFTDA